MKKFWKEDISRKVRKELYKRIMIPSVVYSSEVLSLSAQKRRKIEVFEVLEMWVWEPCVMRRMDRLKNCLIRKR